MALLGLLEPVADVEPAVRQMLDSTCAGHATVFLLDHELATLDELGSFFDIAPLVDLWRHDQPETIAILETLGRHLPDKKLAKCRCDASP